MVIVVLLIGGCASSEKRMPLLVWMPCRLHDARGGKDTQDYRTNTEQQPRVLEEAVNKVPQRG